MHFSQSHFNNSINTGILKGTAQRKSNSYSQLESVGIVVLLLQLATSDLVRLK